MPLEVRNLGAADEDILSGTSLGLLLLDLELHDIRWVLDDLGDIRVVTRSDLTQDTFPNPDDTANKPIPLSDCQND